MNDNTQNSVSTWYQIADFIRRKKDFICIYALLSGISFVLSAIYSLHNPAAGEAFAYNLTLISGVMTLGLVGVCAAAGIGFAAFFSALLLGWSIQKVAHERRMLALANRVPEFDGQSDHLFVIGPGDNREKVEQLQGIESGLQDGVIVGLLQYRQPLITVIHKKKGIERGQINRADLLPDFSGCDFASETAQTFGEYATRARNEFAAYCANVRLQLPGATLYDLASSGLKTSYAIIALLLFSLPAFAQTKTERVNMGLGAAAQTVPQQGKVISYTFTKGTITRHADGVNTVAGLINAAGRVGADADNMGELTGVDISGLAIKAVPQTKQQPQPEKPKPLFQSRIESAAPILPDSTNFEQDLKGAENYFDAQYKALNQMFGKVWASRLTGTFINLILILFLLSVFFSNICNNEVIINRGRTYNAKLSAMAQFFMFVAFVLGIVAVTPILAGAMWYVLEGYIGSAIMVVLQWKAIVTVIMLLIMRSLVVKFVDWLFVAPKQNNGGYHDNGGNRNNNPRIG